MKHNRRRRCRGFATIMAIALIAIVATAILSITVLATMDAKRTRRLEAEAQLQQLLLAGTTAAQERLRGAEPAAGSEEVAVQLPGQLAEMKLSVRLQSLDAAHAKATIVARGEAARLSQSLLFEKQAGAWRVVKVRTGG